MKPEAFRTLATAGIAVAVLAATAVIEPPPRVVWNATASVATGAYVVRATGDLRTGDLMVVEPPDPLAHFLAGRGYVPLDVPLIKPIAALPGQQVCRSGLTITIDGEPVAEARERDRANRPLPVWQGCRTIRADEVFLMNAAEADSLDGRYFGPLPRSVIIGRAVPLWTEATP